MNAPAHTRLGQLQRGRGAGFLAALADPVAARDDVLACVLTDPRVDTQLEHRARYYAELVARLDVPLAPIVVHLGEREEELGHQVVAAAWVRGHGPARELLASPDLTEPVLHGIVDALVGPAWPVGDALPARAATCHAAKVAADRAWCTGVFRGQAPAITAQQSILELLDIAAQPQQSTRKALRAELLRRNREVDRETFARHAEIDEDPVRFRLAASVLGEMGDTRLLAAAEVAFATAVYLDDPQLVLGSHFRQRRAAFGEYVRRLPAAVTLPLARRWHPRGRYFQIVAGNVLCAHCEPIDREWLETFVVERLRNDSGWGVTFELDALIRIADRRSAPVLWHAAEQSAYAGSRIRALRGLARMPSESVAVAGLREAFWDAEDEAVEIACAAGTCDEAAFARLRELAADPVLDNSTRTAVVAALADREKS